MGSIIRKLWSNNGNGKPQSSSGEPGSSLGLRVVNPPPHRRGDGVGLAQRLVLHGADPRLLSIIFIHGLTGGRESTWTGKGATACWPESYLTTDLPPARIITYGYDADVVNFWSMASQNTIGDHSQKFLTSFANLRDGTDTACSMVLIKAARLTLVE